MTKELQISTPEGFLKKWAPALETYAIRKYDQESFIKSAMLAFMENKDLLKALETDRGRISVSHALRFAATTGLSLNPQEGKAAIIAYESKKDKSIHVSYQIMKNGMIDIVLESGQVEFLKSEHVREKDIFKLKCTADGDNYEFEPALKDRGEIIGFFASIKLKSGETHVKWMTIEEIEEFRDKYSSNYKFNKDNQENPWNKSFASMGIKTVMKALLRSVKISDNVSELVNSDNDIIDIELENTQGTTGDQALEKLENKEKKQPDSDGGLL